MAAAILCIFLLVFTSFTSVIGSSYEEGSTDDWHVAIGPVESISAYFDGPTNIVLTWDPPPVYVIHDVPGASFDEVRPGHEVNASRYLVSPAVSQGGDAENASVSEVTNSTTSVSEDDFNHENGTQTENATATETWQCRPISYFSNYSVEMKEDMEVSDNHMTVMWKDSLLRYNKQRVTIKDNQKIVPFSKGCITKFIVLWQEAENESSTPSHIAVPATSRTANITDLEPATSYKITITAVYVSGDEFQNKPAVIFKTKKGDDDKECLCDILGSIAPSARCKVNGPRYCRCRAGYEGQFCEACARGLYRAGPHLPCKPCPCSRHSTRKSACKFVEGFLLCDSCEVGYTGNTCHMCDLGFYRVGYHCIPCFCNGNTAPDAITMCQAVTGTCTHCLHNTTGFNCERCLPGYIGDAITFKNCTLETDGSKSKTSSLLPPEIVVTIFITVVLFIFSLMGFLMFRKYRIRDGQRGLWTIEMDRASEDVNFSTRNQSAALSSDTNSAGYFKKHGLTSSPVKYTKLQEQV